MFIATQTRIFHITHIQNLSSIIAIGGLWCDNERVRQRFESVNIAYEGLKSRRSDVAVNKAKRGTVPDYVPFYFTPRSPMLGAIHTNRVEGYADGQRAVVHLETTIDHIIQLNIPFTFTDGGAEQSSTIFFEDLKDLEPVVSYQLHHYHYFFDSKQYPDRARRRRAEFLAHRFVPWNAFQKIGVYDEDMQQLVCSILNGTTNPPIASVEKRWYF